MAQDKPTDQVEVKALRPFEGVEGYKDETSASFTVERRRAAELAANGLVKEVEAAAKAAPAPENKMAAEPENKVAQEPVGKGADAAVRRARA